MSNADLDRSLRELKNHLLVVQNLALQPAWIGRPESERAIRDLTNRIELLEVTRKLLA